MNALRPWLAVGPRVEPGELAGRVPGAATPAVGRCSGVQPTRSGLATDQGALGLAGVVQRGEP